MRTPYVIAEIGGNHCGSFETAKEMIMMAAQFCKVQVVKFQKRNPRECLTPEEFNAPHPNPANSYGATYGEHRMFLEFDLEKHRKLRDICESYHVDYSTSVWDMTSAKEIISLKPKIIKVPSACNTHYEMLALLCGEYAGDIHISLGMTTKKEEEELIGFIEKRGRLKNIILYHCTSSYPTAFDDINLLEIPKLIKEFGSKVKAIGFSGHHLGIAVDVAAFTLGADWIERHFTLDRTWKGTDHAASLEPDGLRRVARDLKVAAIALQEKPQDILKIEVEQRRKLKWDRTQQKNV